MNKALVVDCDTVTPYGRGTDACWRGLLSGESAIGEVDRFRTDAFISRYAGLVSGVDPGGAESPAMQLLGPLLERDVPADSPVILATTVGAIEYLERTVIEGEDDAAASRTDRLLETVCRRCGIEGGGMVVSAACASSTVAVAQAAAWVAEGIHDAVFVAAVDSVSEFVYSGFSSLMALDSDPARPFDRDRKGLNPGEGAAVALIMSEDRAAREGRPALADVAGWGLSSDANHMTGPSRDGQGLALAIEKALGSAALTAEDIGFISAHGTGTVYNDAMEMKAFRLVFGDDPLPVYSVKGGIGHTMGAAGLVETILAIRTLDERTVPPTVNTTHVDADAEGWVSTTCVHAGTGKAALTTNSGFGGVNAALVLGPVSANGRS
jgi:3-oxoacyl-[acyl-carrier-protein] synthase II